MTNSWRKAAITRLFTICKVCNPPSSPTVSTSMKTLNQVLALAGVAVAILLSTSDLAAQQRGRGNQGQGRGNQGGGRGNFDPAQFQQRRMDNYKERLEVTNDDEWKIISDRIEKVLAAQREVRVIGFGRNGGGGGGGRRGNGGDNGQTDNNYSGGRTNRGGNFTVDTNPELDALQKALDSKAPADEVKTRIARLRDSLRAKEAKLTSAQDDLRKVLSMRQEGIAILIGLLK